MNRPAENIQLVQTLLHKLGNLVHQFQRERGCAGLYLDSLGKIFSNRLKKQVNAVDDVVGELRAFCADTKVKDALPVSFEGRLNFLFVKFEGLDALRNDVLLLSVRYTQALNTYTFNTILPTIDAMIELAQREPRHNSALVSAYSNFLQWKERIGLERALGARGFHTYSFRNQEFCDRFVALIAEQKTYLETFRALASPSQIAMMQECVEESDLSALENLNKLLEDGAQPAEIEQYTGETWFELLTRIIDNLRSVEIDLVDGLAGVLATPDSSKVSTDLRKHNGASSKLDQYGDFLRSLSIFSTLDDGDFEELISFAQIREYEKDKLLFLKDEPATRLYIILDGWVKAYNGLETGEEAILQMLGGGETLLETAVFLNVPTPVSAQIVETATLLSIPAPVIRQRIQSSPQLAVNMLNTVSLRSQRLVQQLELSRLRSVQERVGWFLLRLVLNQRPKDGVIFLPYEKSIIASYLDMRPETFSRTLKKFKKDGFEIASDKVKMPDYQALCDFCDAELAGQCTRLKTEDCPRPDLADAVFSPAD